MLKLKLQRFANRKGARKTDTKTSVTWEVKAAPNGIYIESESNTYYMDFDNQDEAKLEIKEK